MTRVRAAKSSNEVTLTVLVLALTVRQRLARTNVYGQPMTPHFRDIIVEREFESDTRADIYEIGPISGFSTGGRIGVATPPPPRLRQAVRWEGSALAFESGSYTGHAHVPAAVTGAVVSRRRDHPIQKVRDLSH